MQRFTAVLALVGLLSVVGIACDEPPSDPGGTVTIARRPKPRPDAGSSVQPFIPPCVWPTERLNGGCSVTAFDLLAPLTLTPDGDRDFPGPPSVAWDGRGWLVVTCQEQTVGHRLVALRVSPDGGVGMPFELAHAYCSTAHPVVAFDGSSFLVAWSAYGYPEAKIRGIRISRDDEVIDAGTLDGFSLGTGLVAPEGLLGTDGGFVLVYDRWVSGSDREMFSAFITDEGLVFGDVQVAGGPGSQSEGALAAGGDGGFALVYRDMPAPQYPYQDDSAIDIVHLSSTGTVVDAPSPLSPAIGFRTNPTAAVIDGVVFPVWLSGAIHQDWKFALETSDARDGGVRPLVAPPNHFHSPAVAALAQGGALVWAAEGYSANPPWGLWGMPVRGDGGIQVDQAGAAAQWFSPQCYACEALGPRLSRGDGKTLMVWFRNSGGTESKALQAAFIPDP